MALHIAQSAAPVLSANAHWLVFGMGKTGESCARFLVGRGNKVTAVDTRDQPPLQEKFAQLLPTVRCWTGNVAPSVLQDVDAIALSPGVALDEPLLRVARERRLPIVGDVELFACMATAPYAAITGSNGKSTVTTLVAEMAGAAGRAVRAGANLGTPALDLLQPPEPDCYVLELSSFQLELTESLAPLVASILNITPDHLDRHGTLAAYAVAKARILRDAKNAVLNADDPRVVEIAPARGAIRWITLSAPQDERYGVALRNGERLLMHGSQVVIPASALRIKGAHNEFNALAAIAIADCLGVPREAQVRVLQTFDGLAHRCRLVMEHNGISWFNDSKGTNVGASAAAISGIFTQRSGVLIAGGQGKGADFRELRPALSGRVHSVVLLGEDAPQIESAVADLVNVHHASSMREAVDIARDVARTGDAVLLSPACASFDMFQNYEARGTAFEAAVREANQT